MSPLHTDAWSRAGPPALRTSTHAPRAPIARPGRPDESRGRFPAGAASRCGARSRARGRHGSPRPRRRTAPGARHRAPAPGGARSRRRPHGSSSHSSRFVASSTGLHPGRAARPASAGARQPAVVGARAEPSRGCAGCSLWGRLVTDMQIRVRVIAGRREEPRLHSPPVPCSWDATRPPGEPHVAEPAPEQARAVRPAPGAPRVRQGGGRPSRR